MRFRKCSTLNDKLGVLYISFHKKFLIQSRQIFSNRSLTRFGLQMYKGINQTKKSTDAQNKILRKEMGKYILETQPKGTCTKDAMRHKRPDGVSRRLPHKMTQQNYSIHFKNRSQCRTLIDAPGILARLSFAVNHLQLKKAVHPSLPSKKVTINIEAPIFSNHCCSRRKKNIEKNTLRKQKAHLPTILWAHPSISSQTLKQ